MFEQKRKKLWSWQPLKRILKLSWFNFLMDNFWSDSESPRISTVFWDKKQLVFFILPSIERLYLPDTLYVVTIRAVKSAGFILFTTWNWQLWNIKGILYCSVFGSDLGGALYLWICLSIYLSVLERIVQFRFQTSIS